MRRTQVPEHARRVWNRMNQIIIEYMIEQYPDPTQALVLAGEASLNSTWPLTSPGVPSIRMLHKSARRRQMEVDWMLTHVPNDRWPRDL